MSKDSLELYLREKEPDKREKGYAWHTAVGLQAVDGLKPSEYLLETARRNIEGEISLEAELDWTLENRGADGVWPITWKWFGMDQYDREFAISENWWKGMVAIEKIMFLRAFGRV